MIYAGQVEEQIKQINSEIEKYLNKYQNNVDEIKGRVNVLEIQMEQEKNKENIKIANQFVQDIRINIKN